MFNLNTSQLLVPLPEDTTVVDFGLLIDGVAAPDQVEVTQVTVVRCFNRISYATIHLLDGSVAEQALPVSDLDTFSPGHEIEIQVGYLPERNTIFKGMIIRHAIKIDDSGRPRLTIECKDMAVKMTVGRKNAYYFNVSDTDVMETIGRNHGLSTDIESTQVTHAEMVQYFATDWDFLVTRAEANAKLVLPLDGKLVVKAPNLEQAPKFTVTYGSSLFEFEAEMDARHQYPSALATAWDPGAQEIIESETSGSGGGGGLGGALGGAVTAVGGALGANLPGQPPNTDYSEVLGLSHYLVQHSGRLSAEELQHWSAAQFQKSELAKSRGRVKFEGIADIYPGDVISLQGVGARHSGNVFVTAVRHEVKQGSWFTHAQFGLSPDWFLQEFDDVQDKPAAKLLPGVCGLQIGVVTKLENDPEGEHRVQVRLPIIDKSSDGIWVRIASQDAGRDRGAFFLPELGDEVIVGFINDDPRDAVLLGMLYSSAKPTPLTADDDNHEKGWTTRSGMKMHFNDEKKSWTLSTPAGKTIIVDEDSGTIELKDENRNSIRLDSAGITIEAGKDLILKATNDLKIEGINITQSASANLKSEGQARAELTAAGETVVKGGIVRIN